MTKYIEKERARYWPISRKLMAQYRDGSHTQKNEYNSLIWKQNGQLHRDSDKPAWISKSDELGWYQNDKQHRDDDKPAFIGADGSLSWWQNGLQHRFNGPAVINQDGTLDWLINDTLEWWINGENITPKVREWLAREEWQGTPEQIVEFQLRFT